MERDVGKRRRVNESNQDNPEEVEAELREIEVKIDMEREESYERVKEFQVYLEKQTEDEKNEVKQLRAEQDELQALEQQLLQAAVENEEDEESEQVKQSEQSQGQGSPTRSPAPTPTEPTNERLKADWSMYGCYKKQIGRHLKK